MALIKIEGGDYAFIRGEFLKRVHDDITAPTKPGKKLRIITTSDPTPAEVLPVGNDPGSVKESLRAKYRRLRAEVERREGANDEKKESSKKG